MIRPIARKTNPSFSSRCRLAKDGGTEAAGEAPSGGARHHRQQAGRAGHPPRQPGASVSAPPFFAIPSGCFRKTRQMRRHVAQGVLQCLFCSVATEPFSRARTSLVLRLLHASSWCCSPRGYPPLPGRYMAGDGCCDAQGRSPLGAKGRFQP